MDQHSTIPQLPQEVAAHVLRHVRLQQRLGSCSLVCKPWRAAAGAATSMVRVTFSDETGRSHVDSLGQWLSAHGAGVTSLKIDNSNNPDDPEMWLQLPCAALTQLQQLELRSCQVTQQPYGGSRSSSSTAGTAQLQQQQEPALTFQQHPQNLHYSSSSSSEALPTLACLTSLTALTLVNFTCGFADGVAGLSALTGLQRLLLGSLHVPDAACLADTFSQQREQQQQQLLHSAFNSLHLLSQLTRLKLQDTHLGATASAGLFRHMQQLQELHLLSTGVMCPAVLQDLPPSVTKFELNWCGSSQLSSSSVPSLAGLTAMQHLYVDAGRSRGGLHPGFISSMTQLSTLSLQGPMGGGAAQQQQQQPPPPSDGAAAAAADPLHALLEALPGLSQLETLVVINTSSSAPQPLPASDVGKYAALLPASAHLTCLHLTWQHGSLLPGGCWQHVLAGGWQLPQLAELRIGLPDCAWARLEPNDEFDRVERMMPCFGQADLKRLVQRCPGLQLLSIPGLLHARVHLTPLTALTALTWLFVGGEAVDDRAASSVLPALTGLQHLQIYHARALTDRALLSLSALRRLTELVVSCCDISEQVSDSGYEYEFSMLALRTQVVGVPDVWLQLLSRFTRSRACRIEAADQLASVLKAQSRDTKAAEVRANALQQQLAAGEVRTGVLEQQLAAERAAAAALREQLAAATAQQNS